VNPVLRLVRHHPLVSFFVLAYGVAWAFWPFGSFGAFGPLVAALVVVPIAHGRAGLRELGARLIRWRVGWLWWMLAVAVPIAVHLLTEVLTAATGGTPDQLNPAALTTAVMAFGLRLVNPTDGPLAEEPGWRGYAQPTLQGRHSPLVATTILAGLIAGWHLPLFFLNESGPRLDVVLPGLLTTMAVTYWYAWLFNHTGGSALLTLVAHDVEGVLEAEGWLYTVAWGLVAIGLLLGDRRHWLGTAEPDTRTRAEPPTAVGPA
jgi:membrane protease YdiL (CAAX protease family)